MEEIAIIYTTFLRDWLAKKTIISIVKNWIPGFDLFVGDQGREDSENEREFFDFFIKEAKTWKPLPFDCGVSYARNYLIQAAAGKGLHYCLLTADSIEFIPETITNLDKAVHFLENNPNIGILGFDLNDRIPWEYFMDIQDNRFLLKRNDTIETDPTTGLRIKHCDICRQFFLAKINTILSVKWDEALKTGEHEDFFWRYKQSGHKVCWTPDITANYIDYKPAEYLKYRNRQYNEFREMLFKKHNLNDWVQYC
ncbi:MAG: hypothetical protein PHC54_05360 [Candidatus Omnitrophica bacterium]|nr:hypothetical protein [Candidatus Omnitrophota bacterium]MDD5592672.1 hypothetical protein [Candidatus Omnitrophota bacterium]